MLSFVERLDGATNYQSVENLKEMNKKVAYEQKKSNEDKRYNTVPLWTKLEDALSISIYWICLLLVLIGLYYRLSVRELDENKSFLVVLVSICYLGWNLLVDVF